MFFVAPVVLLGFVVGMRHAMDADHVAAVTAIVAREGKVGDAALIGAAWGLGHALSLLLIGGAVIACGLAVPHGVGLALELGVGVMLLAIGVWNFVSPSHSDMQRPPPVSPRAATPSTRRLVCPLVVGGVHGLAGSAAAALLVAATVDSASLGLLYLLIFGTGTMFGMMALTAALAFPLGRALRRFRRAECWMRVASGACSVAIGVLVIYRFGLADGGLP